ncbi:hypothetical protein Esti_003180 [Eimeria stiedai]
MDCRPVDRALAWNVAAATAATRAAQEECGANAHSGKKTKQTLWGDGEVSGERKRKVERRSILVRDLPRNLDDNEARAALRALFSEGTATTGLPDVTSSDIRTQKAKLKPPPVVARQGALPQSSWRNNCQYAFDGSRKAESQLAASRSQRAQLLQQLPYAVSSIRVACDQLGGSAYAFVDFSDELLAKLAIQVLGHSAFLPGTSSQVSLSLHETWSSPLVVDQYHLYVAGLPPGANPVSQSTFSKGILQAAAVFVQLSSVAGTPSRTGVREYAFLRFPNDVAAEAALQKLEEASLSLNLMVRKVYEHRQRGARSEPLTHAANCSIFVANLPPHTNSEELREICSYFHVVQAAEVHPTRNFGFVRLATHEAALAAVTHLHGTQLRGRTLACSWSSRSVPFNEEEQRNDEWERGEEAYAMMSAHCMECAVLSPPQQPHDVEQEYGAKPPFNESAKGEAAHAAGEAFWLSLLAENGPVTLTDVCRKLTQAQRQAQQVQSRIQQWQAQEWEEDTDNRSPQNLTAKPFKA